MTWVWSRPTGQVFESRNSKLSCGHKKGLGIQQHFALLRLLPWVEHRSWARYPWKALWCAEQLYPPLDSVNCWRPKKSPSFILKEQWIGNADLGAQLFTPHHTLVVPETCCVNTHPKQKDNSLGSSSRHSVRICISAMHQNSANCQSNAAWFMPRENQHSQTLPSPLARPALAPQSCGEPWQAKGWASIDEKQQGQNGEEEKGREKDAACWLRPRIYSLHRKKMKGFEVPASVQCVHKDSNKSQGCRTQPKGALLYCNLMTLFTEVKKQRWISGSPWPGPAYLLSLKGMWLEDALSCGGAAWVKRLL